MTEHPTDPHRRAARTLGVLFALASLATAAGDDDGFEVGLASITEDEILAHVTMVADPSVEGRDTPSEGQARVAAKIAGLFGEWGLVYAPDSLEVMEEYGLDGPDRDATEGTFYRPFTRQLDAPLPDRCSLLLMPGKGDDVLFEFGTDYVPVHRASGGVRGDLLFAGFGITEKKERYDDYKGLRPKGAVVLFFEGEPRHKKKFEGPEVTDWGSIWTKLQHAEKIGAVGALVVRRQPVDALYPEENNLDFRYSWASFMDRRRGRTRRPSRALPALEISMECATELLGTDAEALVKKMDRSGRPNKVRTKGLQVSFDSTTGEREVRLDNVVGIVRGSDEALRDEFVVIGAHYDHIGVGPRGRVGCGADDNGSGVASLLEVAQAMSLFPPRRSVMFCLFTAEEDGLYGSEDIAEKPPVPAGKMVAMLNMDQIGFGRAREVAVLGIRQNPALKEVLVRARRLAKTGIETVITGKAEDLFNRSDHYSFHREDVPTLFFFEGVSLQDNKHYHTWRDTIEKVDTDKVTRTTRLIFNTAWILANDDKRPPSPRG